MLSALLSLCTGNPPDTEPIGRGDSWWRHQMETFSALLAICAGIHRSPVNSPHKGQWFSKQSWGWWFETLSRPLWRHRNVITVQCLSSFLSFGVIRNIVLYSSDAILIPASLPRLINSASAESIQQLVHETKTSDLLVRCLFASPCHQLDM